MSIIQYPKNIYSQQGIGLVEVMVALLLLAVAVLGFSAMQMSAVKATDESLLRTRALTVLRGGAEVMRLNPSPEAITGFQAGVNAATSSVSTGGTNITVNSCVTSNVSCSPVQLATRDGLVIRQHALDNNMNVSLVTCPQTGTTTTTTVATSTTSATSVTTIGQNLKCFVASWGTTAAVLSDGAVTTTGKTMNCADSKGVYNPGAQCFIMEAY